MTPRSTRSTRQLRLAILGAPLALLVALPLGAQTAAPTAGPADWLDPLPRDQWRLRVHRHNLLFGDAAASAGDIDGDGFDDVVVGASFYSAGVYRRGRAFVWNGAATGIGGQPDWVLDGLHQESFTGYSVAGAGDVNGDGFDDVLVGHLRFTNTFANQGGVSLFLGSAQGLGATHDWFVEGDGALAMLGSSVSSAGDVNGDGFDDVIIGASTTSHGEAEEGAAYLYLGGPQGLAAAPAWSFEPNLANAHFGDAVASAGDVDADGFDDVLIGAYSHSGRGAAFLFLGGAAGLEATPSWIAQGQHSGEWFGHDLDGAGDVDGDGYDDVIVGAPRDGDAGFLNGKALVFRGGPAGPSSSPDWTFFGQETGEQLGFSVAGIGDRNRDGFDDVTVGAPEYDGAHNGVGRALVFHGSSTGLARAADRLLVSFPDQTNASLGKCVGTAGDVNGDGAADALASAIGAVEVRLLSGE